VALALDIRELVLGLVNHVPGSGGRKACSYPAPVVALADLVAMSFDRCYYPFFRVPVYAFAVSIRS
jgi:hypothetical protein